MQNLYHNNQDIIFEIANERYDKEVSAIICNNISVILHICRYSTFEMIYTK